jgi:hypothetical protein
MEPRQLSGLLRRELDWVVMKALEKERNRRYESAGAFAADVRRYLEDEPVQACPPSAWYRLRKAARRNRTALSVAGVVAAAVMLGTAATLWQASIARADRERAKLAEKDRLAEQSRHQEEVAAIAKKTAEELAAVQRQNALDRAIEAALSGELDKARKAIVAAEAAGVSADQVHWLNGLVHYQRGVDFPAARKEFESAAELKPSVAAQAMLIVTGFAADRRSRGRMSSRELEKARSDLLLLTPVTPEDYMCRGHAIGFLDEGQSMKDFDTAITMRDSPVARAFRAYVASTNGIDKGDLKRIEQAMDDIRQSKFRLRDNNYVRMTSIHTHLHAAYLYGETGQTEKQKAALAEAKDDADVLKDFPGSQGVAARAWYFESVGDDEAALKVLEQASTREETKGLVWLYALALYRKDQVQQALDALDRGQPTENLLRIFLLTEHPKYGPDKAYQSYQELAARRKRDTANQGRDWSAPTPLLFLGKRAEAAEAFRDVASELGAGWIDPSALAKYVAGSMSEEEYLKTGSGGRIGLCLNHYLIGLVLLSEGDREGAREHFQKSIDTKRYPHRAYTYSRLFLERLKDPAWPKWIPVKK